MRKIIIDLCGGTAAWSDPYREAGYDVRIITLPEYDVRTYEPPENVYGILAAPPCDQFSFCRTNSKTEPDFKKAMSIVEACLQIIWYCQYKPISKTAKKTRLHFWALENPFGILRRFLGHPYMVFNPYDFGDNYKKKTCLWGYFNKPELNPIVCDKKKFDTLRTKDIAPEYYGKLSRQERRAITPSGFANAFFKSNR